MVRPEVDSNIASVKLNAFSGSIRNGIDPNIPSIIQNNATIKKPSCRRISDRSFLVGSHSAIPTIKVKKKAAINDDAV